MAKTIGQIYDKKNRNRNRNDGKPGEALYKLINNAVYGKTMENLKKQNVRLVSNEKDYLKWTSKSSYLSQKIFDNDLVEIRKSKLH